MKATKRLLAISLILIFSISLLFAQSTDRNNKNIGSLKGEVYFIALFVDTKDGYWNAGEREYCLQELEKSQEWLEIEAEFYGEFVSFENDHFFFDSEESVYLKEVRMGQGPAILVRKVIKERGYRNFKEFLEKNDFEESVDRLKILLFVKSRGRSHAYNSYRIDDVDIAVVYFQSTHGMMTDQYVISHEILHQFGAWDLYYGESQTLESANQALELYPNSIMIYTKRKKDLLEVDELTAWRVGWKELEPEYNQFNPSINRRNKESTPIEDGKTTIKFNLKRKEKKTSN